jgi:LmbE family N-acetylglucosaminyl deacetylase
VSNYRLLIVAHPDDESLFFMGALLDQTKGDWHVACVTNGNADGFENKRKKQFDAACELLKVKKTYWFGLPDVFDIRLKQFDFENALKNIPTPMEVYTHGPLGEYMHPHHQDVCYFTTCYYTAKCPVYVTAYNTFPDVTYQLDAQQFRLRTKILMEIYGSETMRFINMIPARHEDAFIKADLKEISNIYNYLTKPEAKLEVTTHFEWLRFFLYQKKNKPGERPF